MKTALIAICVLVLLAVGYLSLSLVVFDPPRVNVLAWCLVAAVLTVQSVLTLIAVRMAEPSAALRDVVVVGALVIAAIGVWRVRGTLAGAHFEGYNLLLGAMLLVQAALTIIECRAMIARGAARTH